MASVAVDVVRMGTNALVVLAHCPTSLPRLPACHVTGARSSNCCLVTAIRTVCN